MFATIDIGTNSVLLLIAEIGPGGEVRPVEDLMRVTRLGAGLSNSGVIADAAAERTLLALREYRDLCAEKDVKGLAAVGTAALRRAGNAADFLLIAKKELGLDVEVISEEREAALTFRASAVEFGDGIVVCDIGGGSTEFIATDRDGVPEFTSLPLGCVSLTERFLHGDPETNEEVYRLRREVRESLERELDPELYSRPHDRGFVATAGTATTLMAMKLALGKYDPERVHGASMKIDDLRDLIDAIRPKKIEERRSMPGLPPERADVILAGAELLQETMSFLGYADAVVSDRGVRWGLFYEKFRP